MALGIPRDGLAGALAHERARQPAVTATPGLWVTQAKLAPSSRPVTSQTYTGRPGCLIGAATSTVTLTAAMD
jgi:hypothetical protein